MDKKDSLEKFIDDVVKTVKGGVDKLVEKTDQYTHMGRLKLDIMAIKRDIDKNMTGLGRQVYKLVSSGDTANLAKNEHVKAFSDKIKELEERLALKKDELEHVARTEKEAGETAQSESPEPVAEEPAPAKPKAKPAGAKKSSKKAS